MIKKKYRYVTEDKIQKLIWNGDIFEYRPQKFRSLIDLDIEYRKRKAKL